MSAAAGDSIGQGVSVLGVGAVVESAEGSGMKELLAAARVAGHGNVQGLDQVDTSAVSAKVRRFLSDDDLMAIAAARLSLEDAAVDPSQLREAGCIVCNPGKYTRALERDHPRTRFRNEGHRIDSLALDRAVTSGELQMNPLRLLQQLDNNVLWWLCKKYLLGGINVQYTQAHAPDYFALVEAVATIAFGEASHVLVGGVQSAAQSAPQITRRDGKYCSETDPRAAGLAVFFVLGSAAPDCSKYGVLRLARSVHAEPSPTSRASAPALQHAARLLRHCLGRAELHLTAPEPSISVAPSLHFEVTS